MKTLYILILLLSSFSALAWQKNLKREIEKIDDNFVGEIGVVIKNLKDGSQMEYNANEKWYLSSTMKVIIAISLLEEVERGKLNLEQKVTLKEKNFVDGAGRVLWSKPGEKFSVSSLLEAMLQESDNTAADLLVRLVGADELNKDFKKFMPEAGTATSLLEVRYLTYGELHPKARALSNMDYVLLKNFPIEERHKRFAEKINVPVKELKLKNLEEAHEKYYSKEYNTASLQSYVLLLEQLEKGKLLSPENTELLLSHMEKMKTGDHRLKAGLSSDITLIQKTGTQLHRACNMGLIRKSSKVKSDIAIAVCIKKPSESINSDVVFKKIGQKVTASPLI